MRPDGKRALVTGGGRGIGLAAASALASAGAQVTLAARTKGEIEQAAAAIRGEKAGALVLDVSCARSHRYGRTFPDSRQQCRHEPSGLPAERENRGFRRGFRAQRPRSFFMAQPGRCGSSRRSFPARLSTSRRRWGMSAPRRTVYCASKHAVEGFTEAMAIELAPHNIRVNSLGPTFLETPMTRPFFENRAFRDEVLSKIKLGRLGQLDEITGAIVFLASDASSLMTGSALVLDGGWTAE